MRARVTLPGVLDPGTPVADGMLETRDGSLSVEVATTPAQPAGLETEIVLANGDRILDPTGAYLFVSERAGGGYSIRFMVIEDFFPVGTSTLWARGTGWGRTLSITRLG